MHVTTMVVEIWIRSRMKEELLHVGGALQLSSKSVLSLPFPMMALYCYVIDYLVILNIYLLLNQGTEESPTISS